jgi:hypothetical protein
MWPWPQEPNDIDGRGMGLAGLAVVAGCLALTALSGGLLLAFRHAHDGEPPVAFRVSRDAVPPSDLYSEAEPDGTALPPDAIDPAIQQVLREAP